MKVRTDKGTTEVKFADLATVEPKVIKLRAAFREGKLDTDKVREWCGKLFGQTRFNQDYDRVVGDKHSSEGIKIWDDWINDQPLIHRKLYYDPSIVTAVVMGGDE